MGVGDLQCRSPPSAAYIAVRRYAENGNPRGLVGILPVLARYQTKLQENSPMKWDVLLHWMTHLGEGSWTSFRSAVAKLADSDSALDSLCRSVRIVLSDLGHVDFFVDGSRRWQVLAPVLGGLPLTDRLAILAGGRTPKLETAIAEAAQARGCRVIESRREGRLTRLQIEGLPDDLADVAADAGLRYVLNLAAAFSRQIVPVPQLVEGAAVETAPGNWSVRSFDLEGLSWVDGLHRGSACEFRSRYGERRYYLNTRRGRLLRMAKREAVYAAAMFGGVMLAEYYPERAALHTPIAAPLPEAYSRVGCLCTGEPTEANNGRLIFRNVPFETAALLLVAAGQVHPGPVPELGSAAEGAERGYGQPV